MTTEPDDINADILAAMNEAEEPQNKAPEPQEVAPEPEAEPEEAAPDETEKGEDDRPRGPDGKFLAKEAEPAQEEPKLPESEAPEPPSQAVTRVPSSWSPTAKAVWADLPDSVKEAVAKREREIDQGLRQKAGELKRYEPLEEVIAPYRQKWTVNGVDEATAVKQLLAASDWLDKDPANAIAYLARQYGVNTGGQPQAQPHPQRAPAQMGQASEYQTLQAELAQIKAQLAQTQQAPLEAEIAAFQNDPAHLYFENVKADMALLLEGGRAQTLKEAYDMACYMNPEIRPLLTKPQPVQNTAKADQAKRAAVSVTGSPASQPNVPKSNGTIEDDIRLAMAEVSGQA